MARIKSLYVSQYECTDCKRKWSGRSRKKKVTRECFKCGNIKEPHSQVKEKYTPAVLDPNRRCFGLYRCGTCSNTWASAYSWVGYTQDCRECSEKTLAHHQRILMRGPRKKQKEHLSALCGKCELLGHHCGSGLGREP